MTSRRLTGIVESALLTARSRPCAICTSQYRRALHHDQQSRPLHYSSRRRHASTVNADEISHFSSLSNQWWDEGGSFNVLQRMNKVRVQFLRERLLEAALYESTSPESDREKILGPQALAGLKVLDIGCGGGLFAEVGWSTACDRCHIDACGPRFSAWLDSARPR